MSTNFAPYVSNICDSLLDLLEFSKPSQHMLESGLMVTKKEQFENQALVGLFPPLSLSMYLNDFEKILPFQAWSYDLFTLRFIIQHLLRITIWWLTSQTLPSCKNSHCSSWTICSSVQCTNWTYGKTLVTQRWRRWGFGGPWKRNIMQISYCAK